MFNFNINWILQINFLLPIKKRKPQRIQWIYVLISETKKRFDELVILRDKTIYDLSFTGQVIYLEKLLNDKWDSINKGIFITHPTLVLRDFFYNKAEVTKPKRYLYNKWDSTVKYFNGEFAIYNGTVYRSLSININQLPPGSPSNWVAHTVQTHLINNIEYTGQFNFIVHVPATVTFDTLQMQALINKYKLAGKNYTIITY